jgi:hypothetical protein
MESENGVGERKSEIQITVDKIRELKTSDKVTKELANGDVKADSIARLPSLPLNASMVTASNAGLASPDSICSSPGEDSSAHGTDSEVADALCKVTSPSPVVSPTRRPNRTLGSRLRQTGSPSRLSPQACIHSPSPTWSTRSLSPGPMRERANTAPSRAYIETFYQTLSPPRLPRDPVQPNHGSISDLSSKPDCNNSSDEDGDVFKPLPEMRPRSRTCPEKGAFRRRAAARAKGRPPTPPPGIVADGTTMLDKQVLLHIKKDRLHIHEREMPDLLEDDTNAAVNPGPVLLPNCIQDSKFATDNLAKPVPFKPVPLRQHCVPRIVKKDSTDIQETLFNPG